MKLLPLFTETPSDHEFHQDKTQGSHKMDNHLEHCYGDVLNGNKVVVVHKL